MAKCQPLNHKEDPWEVSDERAIEIIVHKVHLFVLSSCRLSIVCEKLIEKKQRGVNWKVFNDI